MKVVWWITYKDQDGHRRVRESKRHAVDYFSSSSTYCGCSVPDDLTDVCGAAFSRVTCKKCLRIAKGEIVG